MRLVHSNLGDGTDVEDVTDQYNAHDGVTANATTASSDEVQSVYQSLMAIKATVQQYAPQLSSQWGYLAQQGQLITSGQGASLSWLQFVNQAEALLQAASAAAAGAATGVKQQVALTPPAPAGTWLSFFAANWGWFAIGGLAAVFVLPPLIKAMRE